MASSTAAAKRAVVWAGPDSLSVIGEAVAASGVEVVAAGAASPEAAADLSRLLKCEKLLDLRRAVNHAEAEVFWSADTAQPLDSAACMALCNRGVRIVTFEPQAAAMLELAEEASHGLEPVFVPSMAHSPGFRAAVEILNQFGQAQCINVFFRSGPGQGTLYARLYDAMSVIALLCDQAQSINAALAGPLATVPDHLEHLRGHLTVNIRFKSNRCACAALSDSAGSWFRGVTVLGEGGCLRISDAGFDWIDPSGAVNESHSAHGSTLSPGELAGLQVRRLLSGIDAAAPPLPTGTIVGLCEAARLSCLTGQEESPDKLMALLSRP